MDNKNNIRLMPTTEAITMLAKAHSTLVDHFGGLMLHIVEETRLLVTHGSAARQASCAIEYTNFAARTNGTLTGRVFALCADLLWEVEPCSSQATI